MEATCRKGILGHIVKNSLVVLFFRCLYATPLHGRYDYSQPGNFSDSLYQLNCSASICYINDTRNDSATNVTVYIPYEAFGDFIVMGFLSIVLGMMILVTVIGNVFVIAAIFLERNLQNVANYLIVSLAMADLMVACLVMPLGAVYVVTYFLTKNKSDVNVVELNNPLRN